MPDRYTVLMLLVIEIITQSTEVDQMRPGKCVVLCLFAAVFVIAQANAQDDVENLIIENASFEDDYTGWWQGLTAPAEGAHEIDTDAKDGGKSARVDITVVSGTNWHVGVVQNLTVLSAGTLYTADFFAKADVNRVISLELKAAPPLPYAWVGGADMDITTEWTEYSNSFTPSVDYPGGEEAAQICFWVGQLEGQVWIDGVRVYEGPKQDRPVESAVEAEGKSVTTWAAIKGSY
jgi:hypothetical protein